MSTAIEWWRDQASGDLHFRGTVRAIDILATRLDAFDRELLDDCSGSDASAADWLLALELLFRRIHEQKKDPS